MLEEQPHHVDAEQRPLVVLELGAGVVLTAALGRAVQEPVHFDQRPDGPFAARLVEGVQNRKRSCEGFEREYGSQVVCATAQGHAVERAIHLEQPAGGVGAVHGAGVERV